MLKKWISIIVSFVSILGIASLSLGAEFHANPIPADFRSGPIPPAKIGDKAYCVIQNDDGSIAYYYGLFQAGDGVAAYMDPMTCGVPNPYPFRISDVHFYLYGLPGSVWPVQIRVNVRDMAGSDSCSGPGNLLCSETFTIPADSAYPHLINLSLGLLCCVNRPFFLEIIYTGGTSSPYPSLLFADTTSSTDTCNNWLKSGGTYFEWYLAWIPPVPGDIVLRATGNTQDTSCQVPESLYWKPGYEDYAPSGVPDLDQHQDNWYKYETSAYTFCGPVAVANCFKWFDSKYNVPAGVPGDQSDRFPLVRQYIDGIGGMLSAYDDHDPFNMNHAGTPWQFGATTAPPPTLPQPFIPGFQSSGPMPAWGELVERLAWFFDTDGVRTGYCNHSGTRITDMEDGIQIWFQSEQYQGGSTLADTLCEKTQKTPTFAEVESLVEKCEDVILLLGFWWYDNVTERWFRCGGHYVTVAGINSEDSLIGISDPAFDNAESGGRGIVRDGQYIPHTHGSHAGVIHNDEGNVSHDVYSVVQHPQTWGLWRLDDYPVSLTPGYCVDFYAQNIPSELESYTGIYGFGPLYTFVEYAVQISPWDYRGDVNYTGEVELGDVVYLITYLYKSGPPPYSMTEADVNCSGVVELGDVVFLISYLYKNGPVPRCCISS